MNTLTGSVFLLLCLLSHNCLAEGINKHTNRGIHVERGYYGGQRHLTVFDSRCPDGSIPSSFRCGCDIVSRSDFTTVALISSNRAVRCSAICGDDDGGGSCDDQTKEECSQYACVRNGCAATELGGADVAVVRGGCQFDERVGMFVCSGGLTVDGRTHDNIAKGSCVPTCGQPQFRCQFPAHFGDPVFLDLKKKENTTEEEEEEDQKLDSNCEAGAKPDGYICSCQAVNDVQRRRIDQTLVGQDVGCTPYCGDPAPLLKSCRPSRCQTDVCVGPSENGPCATFIDHRLSDAINRFNCRDDKNSGTVKCSSGSSFVEVDRPSYRTITQGTCVSACGLNSGRTRCRFNTQVRKTFLNETVAEPPETTKELPVEPPKPDVIDPPIAIPPKSPPPEPREMPTDGPTPPPTEVPTSVPSPPPQSGPEPGPAPDSMIPPQSEPGPAPDSMIPPQSEPGPGPGPAPDSMIPPQSEPGPGPAPDSMIPPLSEPGPAPGPIPISEPGPAPGPIPISEPGPGPEPDVPEPEPDVPEPEPVVPPDSMEEPGPEPEPEVPEPEPMEPPDSMEEPGLEPEPMEPPDSMEEPGLEPEPMEPPDSMEEPAMEPEPMDGPETEPNEAPDSAQGPVDVCEEFFREMDLSEMKAMLDDEVSDIMMMIPPECRSPSPGPEARDSDIGPEPEDAFPPESDMGPEPGPEEIEPPAPEDEDEDDDEGPSPGPSDDDKEDKDPSPGPSDDEKEDKDPSPGPSPGASVKDRDTKPPAPSAVDENGTSPGPSTLTTGTAVSPTTDDDDTTQKIVIRPGTARVFTTDWGECSQLCKQAAEGSTRERTVFCGNQFGLPLPSDQCDEDELRSYDASEKCDLEECRGGFYVVLGKWTTCSAPCSSYEDGKLVAGTQTRESACLNADKQMVDKDKCKRQLEEATLKRECNTSPCEIVFFRTTKWGSCSCQSRRRRNVICRTTTGETRDEAQCLATGVKKPRTQQRCKKPASCNVSSRKLLQTKAVTAGCENKPCSQRGTCSNGRCTCKEGFDGTDCQFDIREESSCPRGTLSAKGECCPSGVFQLTNRTCCTGKRVQLDFEGNCCDGQLDMCGVCNGRGFVDALGRCCTDSLDAKGICCPGGNIDECGICGGNGTTCDLQLEVEFNSNVSVSRIRNACRKPFADLLRRALDLEDDVEIRLSNVRGRPRGRNEAVYIIKGVGFRRQEIQTRITRELLTFDPSCSFSNLNVKKNPVCGNGKCEIGEVETVSGVPTVGGPDTKCTTDCNNLRFVWCNMSTVLFNQQRPCSGRGRCRFADEGRCECFEGYTGDNCERCAQGFYQRNDRAESDTRCYPEQDYISLATLAVTDAADDGQEEDSDDGASTDDPSGDGPKDDPVRPDDAVMEQRGAVITNEQNSLKSDGDDSDFLPFLALFLIPLVLLVVFIYYVAQKRNNQSKNRTAEEIAADKIAAAGPPQMMEARSHTSIWKDFVGSMAPGIMTQRRRRLESTDRPLHDSPTSGKRPLREGSLSEEEADAVLVRSADRGLGSNEYTKSSIATPGIYNANLEHRRNRIMDVRSEEGVGETSSDPHRFGRPSTRTIEGMIPIDETRDDPRGLIESSSEIQGEPSETLHTASSHTSDNE